MKQLYTKPHTTYKRLNVLVFHVVLLLICGLNSHSQVRVPFAPRASEQSPTKTSYNINGDFTMIGNTNLTLVNYSNTAGNNRDMMYVDIDDNASTFNSSSAKLSFSTENGAIPECSNIIYAGLYWTGRSEIDTDPNLDGDNNPNTFSVTKNGVTKNFNKYKVSIKGPAASGYTDIFASNSGNPIDPINIAYPTNGDERNMYVGYAEITNYVRTHGIGDYYVADIALNEGKSNDDAGFYGGWGMVVVYENSLMNRRDVTVFDGHAFVARTSSGDPSEYSIDVEGFNASQSGNVELKLGLMAGEGDSSLTGDYFEMLIPDGDDDINNTSSLNNNSYQRLSHSGNDVNNFFKSSIPTPPVERNPGLLNNTGIDIAMFNIDNTDNRLIPNSKTFTRFRYGSSRDTYTIFNLTFSLNAYTPETQALINITSVNGNTPTPTDVLEPGDYVEYSLEIKNAGSEATNNTIIQIPLPESVNPNLNNIITSYNTFPPFVQPNTPAPVVENGFIVWDLGTLPVPDDPNTVLAKINFKLTVITDCSILKDSNFVSNITLNGSIVGIGAISNATFNLPFIQGFVQSGACTNNPIPAPIIAINVSDYISEPPTASNPDDIILECGDPIPEPNILVVTDAADNSGNPPTVAWVSDVPDNDTIPRVITRTYSVIDDCGNIIYVTQKITIKDTLPPVLPVLADLTGECSVTAVAPETIDLCSGIITGTTNDPLTYNEQGTFIITWIFDDGNGNSVSAKQNVIIKDTQKPTFVEALPTDITVECDAIPNAEPLTATDNCGDATVSVSESITNGSCSNNYTIARTWTATDNSNLSTTHTQIITVVDTTKPILTTAFDDVLNISCADIPNVPSLEFSDNCSNNTDLTVVFEEVSSFNDNTPSDYQIIRTWIVTDACDNQEIFTQTLNVSLDETITEITASPRCFDDGLIDLNNLIDSPNTNGNWSLIEGDSRATLNANIFDPSGLELDENFFPNSGGIDYVFRYTVTENGCINTYNLILNINADCTVLPCGAGDIVISKAVTPNGDNFNETFNIEGIELCGFTANVKIFNRWGALVFSSNNYTLGSRGDWDGSAPKSSIGSAGKLPSGTYYYIINLENSGLKPITGPVYLGTK